jgi:hypothetical protein
MKLIKEYVSLVLMELLFKIDENGFSDWEEHNPKSVLIPAEARETTLLTLRAGKFVIRHWSVVLRPLGM